jgi:hypothetical protein
MCRLTTRIGPTGKPKLDVGVLKTSKLPKLAQSANDPIAIPRC